MTVEIALLFSLLAVMVALFLTEKLPVDLTAFCGLVVLIFAGYVKPEEAFAGFASNAVITMLSVFFVSAALQYTGVANAMGARIHKVVGSREIPLMVAIMLVAGVLSAFMNNIAAAAVLMPAIASLARQAGVSPSRLMMPLAFGSILGGTMTLVGTPPNLLTTQVLTEKNLEPFALFDFAPFGLALLGLGVLFMITLGRRLLPASAGMAETERADLASVYSLEERLFTLTVPEGSPLDGKPLGQAGLDRVLGVQVVAIERDGKARPAPGADETLQTGDRLVVEGKRPDLEKRLALQGLQMGRPGATTLSHAVTSFGGVVVRLRDGSPLLGRTLRELGFRKRLHVAVAEIWRAGERVEGPLAGVALAAGDEVLALGETHWIDALAARADVDVMQEGPDATTRLEGKLFVLDVPEGSRLADTTIAESDLRAQFDLSVVGIARGGDTNLVISPRDVIKAGDRLMVTGQSAQIYQLLNMGQVEVGGDVPQGTLESEDVGLVEAVVAPRSAAARQTLRDLDFRQRYGLRALALWRNGEPLRDDLSNVRLRLGDGLLLQGPREKIPLLETDPDFVVLTNGAAQGPHRPAKAFIALGALLIMVLLVVTGLFPIQVAAFTAATLVVLLGALKMEEAYRAVEWRAVFLVAAILPVGVAMERTGAAELLATTVSGVAGAMGPHAVLAALMVLSSLLSQGLDGAPTVVILGPVVVSTAQRLGLSPYPLMMGVGLAASAAFMTPFSHKANLLVMGAGGYRAVDYLKVGAPLTVAVLVVLELMIPLLLPFSP